MRHAAPVLLLVFAIPWALAASDLAPRVWILDPIEHHLYLGDQDLGTSPLPGTWLVGPKTIRASVQDAGSGVAFVELRVNGDVRAVDAAAPYEFVWDVNTEPAGPGTHVLTLVAYANTGEYDGASLPTTILPGPPL